jgi:hypothetical protein
MHERNSDNAQKPFQMKKIIFVLIASISINLSVSSQSTGDYRSVSSGNWNDPSKWVMYNGSNWVAASTYPGQNAGTGATYIMNETEIKITASILYPISSLYINIDVNHLVLPGRLVFGSVNSVSLTVSGSVTVYGSLSVADQVGANGHFIIIGGSLEAGTWIAIQDPNCIVDPDCWDCCSPVYYPIGGSIETISNDDKLALIFNTTIPNSRINGSATIVFQDVSFDGIGISQENVVTINGIASFINGIVYSGGLYFNDGSMLAGASARSFADGTVWKRGSGSFMFPIGTNGIYSPLTATLPTGQVTTLSAGYRRSLPYPYQPWSITDPNLYSVSDCEYWELNGYSSDGNIIDYPVDITIGWSNSSACGSSPYVTNVSTVNMARLNFIRPNLPGWDSHGGSSAGTIQSGTVTWTGVKIPRTFTLGNINNSCASPGTLTTTNITSSTALLNWSPVPGSVSYDVEYKQYTTERWTRIATATTATSLNLSDLNAAYDYDWRVRANCNSSSSAYRMTRFTPVYPCGTPSGLNTTNITTSGAKLNWSPLTNATTYSVAYKQSNSTSWVDATINIGSTSYALAGLSAATSYDWRVSPECVYGTLYDIWGGSPSYASFTTASVCNDVYEINNTSSEAKTINIGSIISAGISSATDMDWFKLTTLNNNNTSLEITLSNLPADYDLYFYDKKLKLVSSSTVTGTSNEVVISTSSARNATYYIKVVGKNGAYTTSQCYTLLVQAGSTTSVLSRLSDRANEKITDEFKNDILFPNPANEFVILGFNSVVQGASNVEIMNSAGQVVKLHLINLVKGYNQVQIPVQELGSAIYLIQIKKGELNIIKRFVISR